MPMRVRAHTHTHEAHAERQQHSRRKHKRTDLSYQLTISQPRHCPHIESIMASTSSVFSYKPRMDTLRAAQIPFNSLTERPLTCSLLPLVRACPPLSGGQHASGGTDNRRTGNQQHKNDKQARMLSTQTTNKPNQTTKLHRHDP